MRSWLSTVTAVFPRRLPEMVKIDPIFQPFMNLITAWEEDSKGGTGDGAIAMRSCARLLTEVLLKQARDFSEAPAKGAKS